MGQGSDIAKLRDLFKGIIGGFQIPFDDVDDQLFSILRRGASKEFLILFAKVRFAVSKQPAHFLGRVFDGVVTHSVFDVEKSGKLRVLQMYVVDGEGVGLVQKIKNLLDKVGNLPDEFLGVGGVDDIGKLVHIVQNPFRVNGVNNEKLV